MQLGNVLVVGDGDHALVLGHLDILHLHTADTELLVEDVYKRQVYVWQEVLQQCALETVCPEF